MTDILNISLNGLKLGPVALLDLVALPQVEASPFHNPLRVYHQGGKLHLRHRALPQKIQREQNFEAELGVVLAASATVFADPRVSVPKEMTLLLLVQKALVEDEEAAEPELVLITPSRDGNSDLARPVDTAQQKQALDAMRRQEIEFTPIDGGQANLIDLVRAALLTGAYNEIDVPLDAETLLDIVFELPLELNFDADGLFYFRDVMNGEAAFLFSHQNDFRAATVEVSIADGELFLLEDDAEYLDDTDDVVQGGFSSFTIDLGGAEGFFSRLVVQVDDEAEQADFGIEVTVGAQVIVKTNIVIRKLDIEDEDNPVIDDASGLPEDEMISEVKTENHDVLPEDEKLSDDLIQFHPDVI